MPAILATIIIAIVSFGSHIPLGIAETLFGISLTIKSIIIFLLPTIIFGLLYKASVSLAKDASKIVVLILFMVIVSNFTTTSLSQIIGTAIYNFDLSLTMPNENNSLQGRVFFLMPSLIANHYAMFSGIIIGMLAARANPLRAESLGTLFETAVNVLLKFITILIPVFVTGFVVKLQYDGIVTQILHSYTLIFAIVFISQVGYIFLLYFTVEKFKIKSTLVAIRNMLPAGLSGFSTMSSAASMPLTIVGTEKNAQNKDLVHTVVPATVNIHLIGDCIAIPCFAYAILKNYDLPQPDIHTYFIFTFYFVIAKFSVAAIPGGGIIVMLPILEQYLGFNTEMLSLITALYILFDPIITGSNVLGNGAFARIIDRIISRKHC
ncbi:MAG: dicarboxylate/amino acid:cation symporter [Rickettsiaceae bacterium]